MHSQLQLVIVDVVVIIVYSHSVLSSRRDNHWKILSVSRFVLFFFNFFSHWLNTTTQFPCYFRLHLCCTLFDPLYAFNSFRKKKKKKWWMATAEVTLNLAVNSKKRDLCRFFFFFFWSITSFFGCPLHQSVLFCWNFEQFSLRRFLLPLFLSSSLKSLL